MLRTIERIFVSMRDEKALVGVQGRVARLTSRFTPLLAGPLA